MDGRDLVGMRYEALLDWATPMDQPQHAFQVIPGDFVTTEDGTGIVHTAPTFGADDARVAKDRPGTRDTHLKTMHTGRQGGRKRERGAGRTRQAEVAFKRPSFASMVDK